MVRNKKWMRISLTRWLKHVETLNPGTVQEPPIQTSTRWKPDWTYDSKPLDPKCFSKYYQKKISTPFKCPDCGFGPNPIYPNIVKPTFVWETDANVERCFKIPYSTFYWKGFPIHVFLNNNHFWIAGVFLNVFSCFPSKTGMMVLNWLRCPAWVFQPRHGLDTHHLGNHHGKSPGGRAQIFKDRAIKQISWPNQLGCYRNTLFFRSQLVTTGYGICTQQVTSQLVKAHRKSVLAKNS